LKPASNRAPLNANGLDKATNLQYATHMADQFSAGDVTVAAPNSWPIRAISVLLVIQALLTAAVSAYFLNQFDWERELADVMPSVEALASALFAGALFPLALALLLVAVAFFWQWRNAWLLAMLLEALILSICLWVYFFSNSHLQDSPWLYLVLAPCIVIVPYLNTADVRTAFLTRPLTPDESDIAKFLYAEGLARSQPADPSHERSDF
jgi:hypothetical protein